MKILAFKIEPDKAIFAEVPVPVGSEALSVIIPKSQIKIAGAEPMDLNPMVMVGIPDDTEDSDMVTMYVQVVTTQASEPGSNYLQSIWWSGRLFHLFWGIR